MAADMRVLLVCYAIEAGLGSESGSGYNFARRMAARGLDLTLVTRRNNAAKLAGDPAFAGVRVIGYDPPRALTFWKRKSRGVIPYYYLWQIGVGRLAERLHREAAFDVMHQYNFHADWAPHFLRGDGARIVWGPICHQPKLPAAYLDGESASARAKDAAIWATKRGFWTADLALSRAIARSDAILYANRDVAPPFARHADKVRLRTFGGTDMPDGVPARIAEGPLRLIHIGRMVPIKGPHIALQAVARALALAPGTVHLTLVGDGPLRAGLEAAVAAQGLGDSVAIRRWAPREALAGIYAEADAFLYPSLANQDTVVAEALAAALPVIAVAGYGSELMAGPAALATDPGEAIVAGLARRIAALAAIKRDDPAALVALRETARDRSRAISWDATVDGVLASYRG